MKTKSAITIGFLLIVLTGLLIERVSLYQEGYDIGYKDGYEYIKSVKEFQIQVGTKPDGIWGKESNEKHRLAYGQQSAGIWINNKTMRLESLRLER